MAKTKKTVETTEETKDAAPKTDEKLVSVEMTESEKVEFVKFKAEQIAKADEPDEDQVEVTLHHIHHINGHQYGPGRVVVAESLGEMLGRNDQVAMRARLAVHESNEYVTQILGSGISKTIKLPKSPL